MTLLQGQVHSGVNGRHSCGFPQLETLHVLPTCRRVPGALPSQNWVARNELLGVKSQPCHCS